MRQNVLVSADGLGVYRFYGSDIVGVLLDVWKLGSREYVVSKMPFADNDAADRYCLERGYLIVYSG